ncbi:unnamed protein product [Anisakis simplex]|uniref:Uncharacterized protein n=1 Tax=Anisakis simplex TaxID=6269 RepID=A0A0M3JSQ3_ANISI|nr:unnamed protein product [Anisakis simplex]
MRRSRSSTELKPKQLTVISPSITSSPSPQSQSEIKSKEQSPTVQSIDVISRQQSNQPAPSSPSTTNQSTHMDASNTRGLLVRRTFVCIQGNWRVVDEAPDFSFRLESESLSEVSLKSSE